MKLKNCTNCFYGMLSKYEHPCKKCKYFDEWKPDTPPTQPTTPQMPPVNPPKEEVNHPDRYNTGGVECIDVMLKIFGVDAVKFFCKLNAFKYIWREQRKNGVEDIKKAVWYLNKYIELCDDINENV